MYPLPLLTLLLLPLTTALTPRDISIQTFERAFLSTIPWSHPNHTTKLIGFKRILLTPSQHAHLASSIASSPAQWATFTSAYHDPDERTMRVYFPVENALMYHDNSLIEANFQGEHPHADILDSNDLAVLGRYRTDAVTGVPGNVLRDGVIYLAEPAYPVRRYGEAGNILVYDFGWREGAHEHSHDHEHDHTIGPRAEGKGGSCKQNHGGRVCSQVYGINHGRCPRDYSGCIDYNGWPVKSCKDHGNKFAFPGSDCFTAVARGHCWNEIPG